MAQWWKTPIDLSDVVGWIEDHRTDICWREEDDEFFQAVLDTLYGTGDYPPSMRGYYIGREGR